MSLKPNRYSVGKPKRSSLTTPSLREARVSQSFDPVIQAQTMQEEIEKNIDLENLKKKFDKLSGNEKKTGKEIYMQMTQKSTTPRKTETESKKESLKLTYTTSRLGVESEFKGGLQRVSHELPVSQHSCGDHSQQGTATIHSLLEESVLDILINNGEGEKFLNEEFNSAMQKIKKRLGVEKDELLDLWMQDFSAAHNFKFNEADFENVQGGCFEGNLHCFNAVITLSRALSQFHDSTERHFRVGLVNGGKKDEVQMLRSELCFAQFFEKHLSGTKGMPQKYVYIPINLQVSDQGYPLSSHIRSQMAQALGNGGQSKQDKEYFRQAQSALAKLKTETNTEKMMTQVEIFERCMKKIHSGTTIQKHCKSGKDRTGASIVSANVDAYTLSKLNECASQLKEENSTKADMKSHENMELLEMMSTTQNLEIAEEIGDRLPFEAFQTIIKENKKLKKEFQIEHNAKKHCAREMGEEEGKGTAKLDELTGSVYRKFTGSSVSNSKLTKKKVSFQKGFYGLAAGGIAGGIVLSAIFSLASPSILACVAVPVIADFVSSRSLGFSVSDKLFSTAASVKSKSFLRESQKNQRSMAKNEHLLKFCSDEIQQAEVETDINNLQYCSEEIQKAEVEDDMNKLQYCSKEIQKARLDLGVYGNLRYCSKEIQKEKVQENESILKNCSTELQLEYLNKNLEYVGKIGIDALKEWVRNDLSAEQIGQIKELEPSVKEQLFAHMTPNNKLNMLSPQHISYLTGFRFEDSNQQAIFQEKIVDPLNELMKQIPALVSQALIEAVLNEIVDTDQELQAACFMASKVDVLKMALETKEEMIMERDEAHLDRNAVFEKGNNWDFCKQGDFLFRKKRITGRQGLEEELIQLSIQNQANPFFKDIQIKNLGQQDEDSDLTFEIYTCEQKHSFDWDAEFKMPLFQTAQLVAEQLESLHEKGIVHNDITEGNICFDESEEFGLTCSLIDFDEAVNTTRGSHRTPGGSPLYFAPERLADPNKCSVKTDVYSFGFTLWNVACKQGMVPQEGYQQIRIKALEKNIMELQANIHDLEEGSSEQMIQKNQAELKLETLRSDLENLKYKESQERTNREEGGLPLGFEDWHPPTGSASIKFKELLTKMMAYEPDERPNMAEVKKVLEEIEKQKESELKEKQVILTTKRSELHKAIALLKLKDDYRCSFTEILKYKQMLDRFSRGVNFEPYLHGTPVEVSEKREAIVDDLIKNLVTLKTFFRTEFADIEKQFYQLLKEYSQETQALIIRKKAELLKYCSDEIQREEVEKDVNKLQYCSEEFKQQKAQEHSE